MNAEEPRPAARPVERPPHAVDRMPAVVPVAAGMLVIWALVLFEHARRLLDGTTLAEETLGLSAVPALLPAIALLVLAVLTAGAVLARGTRAWCDDLSGHQPSQTVEGA
jgi:hypothetical protein